MKPRSTSVSVPVPDEGGFGNLPLASLLCSDLGRHVFRQCATVSTLPVASGAADWDVMGGQGGQGGLRLVCSLSV